MGLGRFSFKFGSQAEAQHDALARHDNRRRFRVIYSNLEFYGVAVMWLYAAPKCCGVIRQADAAKEVGDGHHDVFAEKSCSYNANFSLSRVHLFLGHCRSSRSAKALVPSQVKALVDR